MEGGGFTELPLSCGGGAKRGPPGAGILHYMAFSRSMSVLCCIVAVLYCAALRCFSLRCCTQLCYACKGYRVFCINI